MKCETLEGKISSRTPVWGTTHYQKFRRLVRWAADCTRSTHYTNWLRRFYSHLSCRVVEVSNGQTSARITQPRHSYGTCPLFKYCAPLSCLQHVDGQVFHLCICTDESQSEKQSADQF